MSGLLSFEATDEQGRHRIADSFEVEMEIPTRFPRFAPRVKETGGRIPRNFHRFPQDRTLCLGSPLRIKIELHERPTLLGFFETCVIPYLYGFRRYQQDGLMPFDELEHGLSGLLDDYRRILEAPSDKACIEILELLGLKKRVANKLPCPCGSGKRLGRCHHDRLNSVRQVASRSWFRAQARGLDPRAEG